MQSVSDLFAHAEAMICTKAVAPVPAHPFTVAAEMQGNPLFGTDTRQDIESAMLQYQHNREAVYSASSIPSKRIAAQPAFVGRIGTTARKGRSLKDFCREGVINRNALPTRLKELNPENVEILEDHPLIQAINDPNDIMPRWSMLYATGMSIQITGKGFWMMMPDKWPDGSDRIKILYLPATWVRPVHKDGLFTSWIVQVPGATERPIPIPGPNMAYFHLPDPADPMGCLAPIQRIARTVLADESISVAQEIAFKNGIFPVMAVSIGDEMVDSYSGGGGSNLMALEPHQRVQIKQWLTRQYQGAVKYGEPFILDAMMRDIKEISTPPSKMAFQEAGEMTESRVYKGMGVNPIVAGHVQDANRASSAVADHHLVQNTVNPILTLISQVVTKTIAPQFATQGEKLVFWFQPAEAYDPEIELDRWKAAQEAYAVKRNEWRQFINLPPEEDMDDVVIPGGSSDGKPDNVTIEGDETQPDDKRYDGQYRKVASEMWVKQHAEGEAEFAAEMLEYMQEQAEEIAEEVEGIEDGIEDAAIAVALALILRNAFSTGEQLDRLKAIARDVLSGIMLAGAAGEMSTLPQSIAEIMGGAVEIPPEAVEEMDNVLSRTLEQSYWEKINDTTRDAIQAIIDEGIKNDESMQEIARKIREASGGEISKRRAEQIARTETTNGLNAGHWAVRKYLQERGLVASAEWRTMRDSRVRGNEPDDEFSHVIVEGQTIRAGEMYNVDGEEAPWPAHYSLSAGNRINCRCQSMSLFDGLLPFEDDPEDLGDLGEINA